MHADLDIIAHRGASGICGEGNSLKAFRHAMAMGCDYLETDLRCTADDYIICFHDADINGAPVAEMNFAALKQRCAQIPPTLEELLDCCAGHIGLDLEIKCSGFEARLLQTLAAYPIDEQLLIKSFERDVLQRLRELHCRYPLGLLIAQVDSNIEHHLRDAGAFAEACELHFCSPHQALVSDDYFAVDGLNKRPCLVWTVNSVEEAQHLLQFPIHGLITDRPDLMQVLAGKKPRPIDRAFIEDALRRYHQGELIAALTHSSYQSSGQSTGISTRCIDFCDDAGSALASWSSTLWGSAARICCVYDQDCADLATPLIKALPYASAVALEKQAPYSKLTPRQEYCAQIEAIAADCDGIIAIGSGTVNDICKYSAERLDKQYIACATAASMNGYTSSIAALLVDELKSTLPCRPPAVVISDRRLLRDSPLKLSQSGYADLLSKFVSVSDWKLAALVRGEAFDDLPGKISSSAIDHCIQIADHIGQRDEAAIHELMQAIILSGYSMALAGSSAPASGGEHLISHYLDMTAYAGQRSPELHGLQVALGILLSARSYEVLQQLDPKSLTIRLHSEDELKEAHGHLWPVLADSARAQLRDAAAAQQRLDHIKEHWQQIWIELDNYLIPHAKISAALQAAGVACHPAAYGFDMDLIRTALIYAADMRNRYSIWHFARDCGALEDIADEVLATAFTQ